MKGEMGREEIRSLSKIQEARYRLQKNVSFLLPQTFFEKINSSVRKRKVTLVFPSSLFLCYIE